MFQPATYSGQRFSIYPTYIVATPTFEGGNWIRSKAQRLSEANLKDNKHEGQLSKKASTKLRNSVNWLVQSASWKRVYSKAEDKHFHFRVNFITLTIPQQPGGDISGKDLHSILHTWLVYARKYFYLKNYVWKIEKGKFGKLHIHVTGDTFIHYRLLRDSWNRILMKKGLSDDYFDKHGHYDPNSTDIHSVYKVRNIAGYLCKYMSKDSGLDKSFSNRIWGSSTSLSAENKCRYIASADEVDTVGRCLMNPQIRFKPLEGKPDVWGVKRKIGEIFFLKSSEWLKVMDGEIRKAYDDHRFNIRHKIVQPPGDYFCIDPVPSTLPIIQRIPPKQILLFELN